jgi:hypothetical protein
MNWAQENKTLAGIVGVMVAGGLGLGVWLYLSWDGYSKAMEEWNTTQDRIVKIRSEKLEPTAANVALREKQLTEYADKVNQLRGALLAVQQTPTPLSETAFQAKLKERATAMKNLARTLGMKALPDDFALGFDRYASQPPRSPEVAAELSMHLDAMEKLVTTCIESGVAEINMLERTKLANEDAPLPPPPPPTKSKSKTTTRKDKKAVKTLITEQSAAEPVLDRYPVKLLLTTDQGPFQTILNTLCHPGKMPYFFVVRQLRVENTRLDGPTKEEIRSRMEAASKDVGSSSPAEAAKPPDAAAAAAGGQVIVPPKPGPKDAIDLLGGEMLKVYMEVDYIRFRPAAKVESEDAAPAATATAPATPAKP